MKSKERMNLFLYLLFPFTPTSILTLIFHAGNSNSSEWGRLIDIYFAKFCVFSNSPTTSLLLPIDEIEKRRLTDGSAIAL